MCKLREFTVLRKSQTFTVICKKKIIREFNLLVNAKWNSCFQEIFRKSVKSMKFGKCNAVTEAVCTVWKLGKFTFTLFWQKFRENNVFITKITL